MRARNIKKQVWLNREEATLLRKKSKKAGLTESDFIRLLITGCVLKEKPDERFYEEMKEMRNIGNNLNQLARKANILNFIDVSVYKNEAEKWNQFMLKIKRNYLLPSKEE